MLVGLGLSLDNHRMGVSSINTSDVESLNEVYCVAYLSTGSNHWMFDANQISKDATAICVKHLESIGINAKLDQGPQMGAGGPGTFLDYLDSFKSYWGLLTSIVTVVKAARMFLGVKMGRVVRQSTPLIVVSVRIKTQQSFEDVHFNQAHTNLQTCLFLARELSRLLQERYPNFQVAEFSALRIGDQCGLSAYLDPKHTGNLSRYRMMRQLDKARCRPNTTLAFSYAHLGTLRRLETALPDPSLSNRVSYHSRVYFFYVSTTLLRDYRVKEPKLV